MRPRGDAARSALRAVTLAAAAIAASILPSTLARHEARGGSDVAIVLDVSMSMLAADVAPDRLSAARREMTALLHATPPGRAAVIAFAGDARVICPLTSDIGAVIDAITAATPASAAPGGSEVAVALDRAGEVLKGSGTNARVILVTDGEPGPRDASHHVLDDRASGDASAADTAARQLAARGVALTVIGVGTAKGAPVPVRDGRPGQFVQDGSDSDNDIGSGSGSDIGVGERPRLSRLDVDRLRGLADQPGGRYAQLETGGSRPGHAEGLAVGIRRGDAAVPDPAVTHDLWTRTGLLVLVAIGALLIDTALWWLRRSTTPWY